MTDGKLLSIVLLMLGESNNECRKPIDKTLQKGLRALVTDVALLIDQTGLERDIGLAPRARACQDLS